MAFKVLVPLDGSEFSREALGEVMRLLNPKNFQLTLLRVAPVPQGITEPLPRPLVLDAWMIEHQMPLEEHHIYASQVWESIKAELRDSLVGDMNALEKAGFAVSLRVGFGDAADEIVATAREGEFDLVAMATHGRSGLRRVVMGSVAEKVLRGLEVPVLMVHPVRAFAGATLELTTSSVR